MAALTTTARRDGGDLVISGTKMWITSGLQADWACLLANTSQGKPHANKSLIVVPMDAAGITKAAISKMGMHVSPPIPTLPCRPPTPLSSRSTR